MTMRNSPLSNSPDKVLRAWSILSLLTLVAAIVMAFLALLAPEMSRRALVAHAAFAALLWPLSAVGTLAAQRLARSRPALAAAGLWTVGSVAIAVVGLAVSGVGKPTLVSFMPLFWTPLHAFLLAAGFMTAIVMLAATLLPAASPDAESAPEGLAWFLLPLVVTFISLLWAWVASPQLAGHVRAELVLWAAGHAWQFALAMLAAWTWLQLAGVGRPMQSRCALAAALPVLGVLAVQAWLPIEQEGYLRQFPALLSWALWPVPAALIVWLLRDSIYRAAGGAFFWLSALAFVLSQAAAAGLLLSGEGELWGTVLQHGIGLAVTAGLVGVLLRQPELAAARSAIGSGRTRAAAVGSIIVLLVSWLVGLPGAETGAAALRERAFFGQAGARKHVESKKAEEIRTRFEQGVAMMQMRQFDYAVQAFHRVLELNPTLTEAHVNMGFALYEKGDFAGAQRFFEGAIALNKDQINAYYGLAIAANAQKNFDVAVGAMRAWLHLAPADDPFRAKGEALFDSMHKAFVEARKARGEDVPPNVGAK